MEIGGIGFGNATSAALGGGPAVTAQAMAPLEGEVTADQLAAEYLQSSQRIGTLAAYSGGLPSPAPNALSPAGVDPAASIADGGGGLTSTAPSPFTPARSWTSLVPQGASDPDGSGASADQAMADFVGGGDVFSGDVFSSDQ